VSEFSCARRLKANRVAGHQSHVTTGFGITPKAAIRSKSDSVYQTPSL
jgi:hypothetical protein